MPAPKPLLVFSGLLALSLTVGWRSGSASASAAKSSAGSGAGPVSGSTDAAHHASGSGVKEGSAQNPLAIAAPPDTAAVKAELEALIHRMNEYSGDGMDKKFLEMWGMARLASLLQKLSPEEQDSLLSGIEDKEMSKADIQEAKMFIQSFGAMMGGGKAKTTEDYIKELATVKGPPAMATMTFLSWAAKDTTGALHYLKNQLSLPEPPAWAREDAGVLFNNMAMMNPQLTAREALTIPDEKLRKEVAGTLSLFALFGEKREEWPADGTETVENLIRAVPEKTVDFLTGALNGRLNDESPQEAMRWLETSGLAKDHKAEADEALRNAWWNKSPVDAANWWIGQTPPEKKATAVEETVKRWTNAGMSREFRENRPEPDLAGCADWILSVGIGPDTEKGISRLADAWIDAGEPAAAIAWAKAIPDAEARQASLTNVSTQIQRRYPDTWRAMLTAAGLPLATAGAAVVSPGVVPVPAETTVTEK